MDFDVFKHPLDYGKDIDFFADKDKSPAGKPKDLRPMDGIHSYDILQNLFYIQHF